MAVRLVCSFLARPVYTSDSDVISFHVYASKFSPPSCRYNSDECSLLTLLAYRLILIRMLMIIQTFSLTN